MANRIVKGIGSGRLLWLLALALGDGLLLTPAGSPLRLSGSLLLLLLPGVVLWEAAGPRTGILLRWTVGLGLSYAIMMALGFFLPYVPASVQFGAVLAVIHVVAIGSLWGRPWRFDSPGAPLAREPLLRIASVLVILCLAAAFRFTNLGFSEFQGDEIKALVPAARALEGHHDALIVERKKGPGEVLPVMFLWRLSGTIDEGAARLPFALASLLAVPATYLLGRKMLGTGAALAAAWLLALNGFMVAFGRVVQYQSLVVLMSALALLCAWLYCESSDARWAGLAGVFLGSALLAHYDAIFVIPAIAYVTIRHVRSRRLELRLWLVVRAALAAVVLFAVVAGPFCVAYLRNAAVSQTGSYLSERIGLGALQNNLAGFLEYCSLYGSFYATVLTGLLALGALAWALRRLRWPGGSAWLRYGIPVSVAGAALVAVLWPEAYRFRGVDFSLLPFVFLFLGAVLSPGMGPGGRTVVIWMAIPFLAYTFTVADPRTHVYALVNPWLLLAAVPLGALLERQFTAAPGFRNGLALPVVAGGALALTALFGSYLGSAFVSGDVDFLGRLQYQSSILYWFPYETSGKALFGFAHCTGWKAVEALYADGTLNGSYRSNEKPAVTAWYTLNAIRCDASDTRCSDDPPRYYFIADQLIDHSPIDANDLENNYVTIARADTPGGKGLTIYEIRTSAADLGGLDVERLAQAFDRVATPGTFAGVGPDRLSPSF